MRAALQTLATLGKSGHRTIAILGQMAELGEFSNEEHDSIGRLVVRLNIDKLFVVGQEAKLLHMAAAQEGSWMVRASSLRALAMPMKLFTTGYGLAILSLSRQVISRG